VSLLVALLVVAGCTSIEGASAGPSTSAATATPVRTALPPAAASPSTSGAASPSSAYVPGCPARSVCTRSTEPTVVAVTVEDFDFVPAVVEAETGEVITFSNTGFESHNATLDSGACGTVTLETGGRDGIVFGTTGTFAFHCTVHLSMTGRIVIRASAGLDGPRAGSAQGGGAGSTTGGAGRERSGDLDGEQGGA